MPSSTRRSAVRILFNLIDDACALVALGLFGATLLVWAAILAEWLR
jgi:hypothetical protein